jgi:hypothetical protein
VRVRDAEGETRRTAKAPGDDSARWQTVTRVPDPDGVSAEAARSESFSPARSAAPIAIPTMAAQPARGPPRLVDPLPPDGILVRNLYLSLREEFVKSAPGAATR